MERIRFNNETTLDLNDISSSDLTLTFSVRDDLRDGMEAICKNHECTDVIKLLLVNESGEESVIKGYAGYTILQSIKTEYDVVTNIDYETTNPDTESGFAEEVHDITTVILRKPTKVESDIAALKDSQAIQDGAIDELAEVVSEIAG